MNHQEPGTILRFYRNQHGRKETYPFTQDLIKKESEEQTYYRGKSMVTQSKEVVNSGDWVEYTKYMYNDVGADLHGNTMPTVHTLLD